MSVRQGRFGIIAFSFDGGVTYTNGSRVVDITINQETDEVEFTSHDSQGNREYQAGLSNSSIDFNLIYDDSDAGFINLENSYDAKATFQFRFRPSEASGLPEQSGSGFLTSFSQAAPLDGMQTVDCSMRVSGGIQRSSQA